ncbi:MAG: HAMP domain-containing histidine kinase [Rhodobacteraceae bacterium]|nr:HAMP domain-containing histidine kinase [Paracoccaceae bacterium]
MPRVTAKWRPTLLHVLGGVLGAVLAAPLLGFIAIGLLRDAMGFRQSVVLVSCVVLLITCILGYVLWRVMLRPMVDLENKALSLRNGDASALSPLEHYGTRELGDLGQSVLDMANTLINREATIRTYTDHVTHELKSPLTAIKGAAELLASTPQISAEDAQLAQTVLEGTKRMERQLTDLRRIAKSREPSHRGRVQLAQLLPRLSGEFPNIAITASGERTILPINAEGLTIVLHHLIDNAVGHGAKTVKLAVSSTGSGVTLWIADDGSGVSEGNRRQIFDPFFTTRREVGGTGMGLSIVQNLIEAHDGRISLEQAQPSAVFSITF